MLQKRLQFYIEFWKVIKSKCTIGDTECYNWKVKMTNCIDKFHFPLEIFTTGTYTMSLIKIVDRNKDLLRSAIRFNPLVTSPLPSPPFPASASFLKLSSSLLQVHMRNWPTVAVIFDLDPESWFSVFAISVSATIGESKARVSTGSNSIPPAKVVIGHHRFSGRPPAWPSCSFEVVARFPRCGIDSWNS